jgi:hypothetical protein
MVAGKQMEAPLTWDQVKAGFSKSAPLLAAAYEASSNLPDAGFTDVSAGDLRGLPSWRMDERTSQ